MVVMGRNMKQCKMPSCRKVASSTWSLVDVCCHCFDDLQAESHRYYAKRMKASDRILHEKIKAVKRGQG